MKNLMNQFPAQEVNEKVRLATNLEEAGNNRRELDKQFIENHRWMMIELILQQGSSHSQIDIQLKHVGSTLADFDPKSYNND